jgi:DNA-binding beta-propeller fold protein YncE
MKTTKLLLLTAIVALTFMVSCKDDEEPEVIPTLYFMDTSDEIMGKIVLDGTNTVTTVKDVTEMSGPGIAYDDETKMIYFSDYYDADTPDGKIWRMKLDGTGLESIASGILDPYGIAIDHDNDKIYWADDAEHISRANLDGSSLETGLVTITDAYMRAVAIDEKNDKLYFYEVWNEDLYVANLDGSNPTVLIAGVYGYAIFIDSENSKIYFDDQNTPGLKRANLDGSGVVDIDNTDTRIYGIAIDYDKGKMYWSGRDTGEIYEANLNGTGKVTIATGLSSPRGLVLVK